MGDNVALGIDVGTTRIKAEVVGLDASELHCESAHTPWQQRADGNQADLDEFADVGHRGQLRDANGQLACHHRDGEEAMSTKTMTQATPRRRKTRRKPGEGGPLGVLAWVLALCAFAPIAFLVLTSFHAEVDAATSPPNLLAPLTLDQYRLVFSRNITPYMLNSLMAAGFSTLLVVGLAVPAAYATAVKPIRSVRGVMGWVLSTKFLPMIAALLPVYLTFQYLGLLDNILALAIFYAGMNLPVAIWMMHSFMAEIPKDVLAAAEVDGASLPLILRKIVLPLASPGIAATGLICFIFAWNEFLFALNLTATKASTSPVYLVSFITSEGLFIAQLSAAALVVSIPVILVGWVAQDKLVQGLSLGAVK